MPAIPQTNAIFASRLAVALPRYAQIVDYAEPAFFGVNHPDNKLYACREIWSHDQRIAIYRALQEAQSEVEKTIEYPLMPTWFGPERHPLIQPQLLNYGMLIQMGQRAVANVALGIACNHPIDPVTLVINPVTFTDVDEVHIYHPGTDVEIYPSGMSIVAGTLNISIPRVRMVAIANESNPPEGLDYTDTSLFEQTVDVKREYLSPTLPSVEFVSLECSVNCECPTESRIDGCAYVRDTEMSIVQVGTSGCVCIPARTSFVDLYYQAGLLNLTPQAEDIIVRLAHSRMPNEPCGCNVLKMRWEGDQKVPEVLTAERENCPYGLSQGAWSAFTFAQNIKQVRMGVL